jgi:hypothetical protein
MLLSDSFGAHGNVQTVLAYRDGKVVSRRTLVGVTARDRALARPDAGLRECARLPAHGDREASGDEDREVTRAVLKDEDLAGVLGDVLGDRAVSAEMLRLAWAYVESLRRLPARGRPKKGLSKAPTRAECFRRLAVAVGIVGAPGTVAEEITDSAESLQHTLRRARRRMIIASENTGQ